MTELLSCPGAVLFSGIPGWSRPFPKAFEGPFNFLSVCHRGTLSAGSLSWHSPPAAGTFLEIVYYSIHRHRQ